MRLRALLTAVLTLIGLLAVSPQANAAPSNSWGFAYVDAPAGVPNLSRQAGSWPPGFNVNVSPGGVGETFVRFPQIAGKEGVVHVTAVRNGPVWCQAWKWGPVGPDQVVVVRCFGFGGVPTFVPFTVMFAASTDPLPPTTGFGYVHYEGGVIVSQYNSTPAVNTVTPVVPGVYKVTLPGLGTPLPAGGLQVTAVNQTAPARCKVGSWSPSAAGQTVEVRCHNAVNTLTDSGFSLTYQRERSIFGGAIPPKYFGYTFDVNPGVVGPYSPTPVGINYNSVGSTNTIQSAGPGLRLIVFNKIGILQDHVQVTAYGSGPEYCNLIAPWSTWSWIVTVRDVACWNALTRVDSRSLTTYTSAL